MTRIVSAFGKFIFSVFMLAAVFYFRNWADRQYALRFPVGVSVSSAQSAADEKLGNPLEGTLDVNSASLQALVALPGIGPKLAEAILKSREDDGPFLEPKDLLRIKGIGEKKLEKMMPFLRFESPSQ